MNNAPIREYIYERAVINGLQPDLIEGKTGSVARVVRWFLDGKAKLPLDRVTDAAMFLGCDPRHLFWHALKQFFNDENIALFENMLGSTLSADEEVWLTVIRSVAGSHMKPPSHVARGVIHALFKDSNSSENITVAA